MKIIRYKKKKGNKYEIIFDKGTYELYDDIIIKYELLLKKELDKRLWDKIIQENNLLNAYYEALKAIDIKIRAEKEIKEILIKKGYQEKEINYALLRLNKEGYLNHQVYIEAFIHDSINLKMIGDIKIKQDLLSLGFDSLEIDKYLDKIDDNIYREMIQKYVDKKLKANRKSEKEFKIKTLNELINKGFRKEDIGEVLDKIEIKNNEDEIKRIVEKLYKKYIGKYDIKTTQYKIKTYLYSKGYTDIDVDSYIKKAS